MHCNLMEPDTLRAAMVGVDAVVNCARSPSGKENASAAARNLAGAASSAGVSRLIHQSSIAVYGTASGLIGEDLLPQAPVGAYGQEKMATERILQEAASSDLRIVILRPGLVYGRGGAEWVDHFIGGPRLDQLCDLGEMGEGDANLIHVDDLAAFCVHLASADIPEFSVCNIVGDAVPSFNAYFRMLVAASGRDLLPPRITERPAWDRRRSLRRALRRLTGKMPVSALRAPFLPGPLDDAYDRYATRVRFTTDRAQALGFVAMTGVDDGVREAVGKDKTMSQRDDSLLAAKATAG